ncbi:MAG: tRNA (N6-isopentenyl adenosine(37)-C2)-methylthiotransferase MiaB [Alphaproteobacteria bacterium]|nr:tRNA (N6-isopentenyl adenosine(37)-C2)-methylthiotransferase MiaB [Alphaproteobacteria bacterium]
MKKFLIRTFGCAMNVYDSERLKDTLASRGWSPTEDVEVADLIVLNTCSVREKATEKVFSHLGKFKKLKDKKPSLKLAVIGCVAKELGTVVQKRAKYVEYVFGPQSWHLLLNALENQPSLCDVGNYKLDKFNHLALTKQNHMSGFISIQEGCDNMCTYCIVPHTRGREISRAFDEIMQEVAQVVKNGAIEIVFLGQNVNNYKDDDGKTLADLIRATAKISEVQRIRYLTSYPTYLTDDLIDLFRIEPKLMPFLNLPIQAGSNAVLKKMNRHYSREQYLEIIKKLKTARSDIAISSDFIVGFCGETEEDFEDSLDIIRQVKFVHSYSFKYSQRPHTAALKMMEDDVSPEDKTERLNKIQALLKSIQKEYNESFIGKQMEVLIEENPREGFFRGRSPYMHPVEIKTDKKNLIGQTLPIAIYDASPFLLYGEIK